MPPGCIPATGASANVGRIAAIMKRDGASAHTHAAGHTEIFTKAHLAFLVGIRLLLQAL
jgi:hypothetical protein